MTVTHSTTELPPFLLQHLDKGRVAKSRSIMPLIQKTPEPKIRTSSWKQNIEKQETPLSDIEKSLQDLGITGPTLNRLLATYTHAELFSAITFVKDTARKQTIHNLAGFTVSVLTHGWDLKKQTKAHKNEKTQPMVNLTRFPDNIEMLEENNLCKTLRQSLCEEIGAPDYISWFSRTHWKTEEAKLIIETPSTFVHSELSIRFQHLLQRLLHKTNNKVKSCTLVHQ